MGDRRNIPPPTPLWIDVVIAALRFAPGAVLGAAIGFREAARWAIDDRTAFAAVIGLPALILGWVSAKFGLALWEGIRDFVYWPRKF